jgi:putative flippase GtrA
MNTLQRFTRFLLVGAMGMALQLVSLALLHRLIPGHDLWTTAAALELTLLHNFTWHLHYTWRDRPGSRLRQCLRFHLSNGLLSLLGNVTIVATLLRTTHLHLVLANVIAIAACSLANFCVGNLWAFAQKSRPPQHEEVCISNHSIV